MENKRADARRDGRVCLPRRNYQVETLCSNACEALGVEVIKCDCHCVNFAVLWSLGISGAAARCKNKSMGELMKKLAACVGVFRYS
ncbi:unnamed protein product, partial [Ascophyllum nodosum]